jgi:hypothetical protein
MRAGSDRNPLNVKRSDTNPLGCRRGKSEISDGEPKRSCLKALNMAGKQWAVFLLNLLFQ